MRKSASAGFSLSVAVGMLVLMAGPILAGTQGSIVGWGAQTGGSGPNEGFTVIAAGTFQSMGLYSNGSIAAWGATHVLPTPNGGFTAIAGAYDFSLAIRGYLGDIDGDGHVDVVDLLWLIDSFGTSDGDPGFSSDADCNSDRSVDVTDLLILVGNFGK